MAASPSSSPRLPSPPPIAEDQLGPKSPIAMPNDGGDAGRNPFEANASRRIRPGTKAADMALGPPLVPLGDIDSPFHLTEHLKSLHTAALHRNGPNTLTPIDRPTALRLSHPPDNITDKYLWLYELCRLLCKELNAMIVALFSDNPPCSAQTCNEMRASEWQYLCAVHDPPKPCCAIDYCCHTLDWTGNVLTSQKNFPSRMGLDGGAGAHTNSSAQLRQLTNIFRRVYRIFAHAWFQHREMYWKVEQRTGLYVFFKTVCDVYNLIPEDNYTVPPEAEGIEPPPAEKAAATKPKIMKRDEQESSESHLKAPTDGPTATKRHRHTPSVGSESITTVLEDPEEDEEKSAESSDLEETVILSSEPPEYSAAEVETTPDPVVQNLAPTEDEPVTKAEEESGVETATAEIPTVTVGEAVTTPDEKVVEIEPIKTEAESTTEVKEESEDAGEKEASSAVSDTDSHGSWQVLSNEQSSTEATPASSVAEVEAEAEAEPMVKGDSEESTAAAEQPSAEAEDIDASKPEAETTGEAAKSEDDALASQVAKIDLDGATDEDIKQSIEVPEPESSLSASEAKEVPEELKHLVDAKADVPEVKTEDADADADPVKDDALSKSERRKSKIPRAVSPAVKKVESPKVGSPVAVKEEGA